LKGTAPPFDEKHLQGIENQLAEVHTQIGRLVGQHFELQEAAVEYTRSTEHPQLTETHVEIAQREAAKVHRRTQEGLWDALREGGLPI
jgi:hypothetical protein